MEMSLQVRLGANGNAWGQPLWQSPSRNVGYVCEYTVEVWSGMDADI